MNHILCGAAERVITPEFGVQIPGYFRIRPADGIKSDLKAHTIVLDNGTTRLVIIHLDIICFKASLAKKIRRLVWEKWQIPASNVMVCATHTHTGSASNYRDLCSKPLTKKQLERLIDLIMESISEAYEKRRAVVAKYAFGEETRISFNRNYLMTDGTIVTNPGKRRPFEVVKPISPIDHTLGVIRFDTLSGTPVAQIVNFACHPDTVGGTEFCADYPGELCELQQKHYGEDFVTVYLNGASGNVNHINAEWFKTPGFTFTKGTHHQYMGKVLSDDLLTLHNQMTVFETTNLSALSKTYRTARRQPSDADMEWVEGVNQNENASPEDRIYAYDLTALRNHPKLFANVEIQAFAIGDCRIVTLPCEAYADIALAIRKETQNKKLMVSSLTNDYLGYVVTEPAFSAGVYESKLSMDNSFLPPSAADEMADCAVKLLNKMN